jgi:type IV pilus assembly protein PilC
MAVYKYKALDQKSKHQQGKIEAGNASEASTLLLSKGLNIISLEVSGFEIQPVEVLRNLLQILKWKRYTAPSTSDKILFLRQLSLMLRSGNTLIQGLQICSQMTEKRRFQRALVDMLVKIQGGSGFAVAIEAQGSMFPPVVNRLVASAEMSGELQPTLERLADNLDRSAALKKQFNSAMIYPSILFLISFAVFMGLALSIVPKFATMIEGKSQELPAITQAMLDVSAWMVDYGVYLFSSIGLSIFSILVAYTTEPGKKVIDQVMLNFPVVGTAIRTSGMAQMGWTMSMLLSSGLTVLESLRVITNIIGNKRLSDCFSVAGEHILSGRSLAAGLKQPHIPIMVQHMTGIGERSGELEHVMKELGQFYQNMAEQRIKSMIAMIEPAMTLIVGGMVAFVYIGFFKAMIQVSAG